MNQGGTESTEVYPSGRNADVIMRLVSLLPLCPPCPRGSTFRWPTLIEKPMPRPTVGVMSLPTTDDAPIQPLRIAVTGAAGMIGSAVARRLAELGHELSLLDQKPLPPDGPAGRFIQADARDREAVREMIAGVDVVCHIGEIPNIIRGFTADEVFDTNTAICRTMLEVSREQGVRRFIYTSSCQRYGFWGSREVPRDVIPSVWPLDERQPPSPRNRYAESKVVNEQQCAAAAESGSMEVFVYRFPWVMARRALERAGQLWAHGRDHLGEGFWTYLDLRDAVEAYVLGVRPDRLLEPAGRCEAFHFVADEAAGGGHIRERLRRFLPDYPPLPADWPDDTPPVSCQKAARLLGWRPRHRLSDVLGAELKQNAG